MERALPIGVFIMNGRTGGWTIKLWNLIYGCFIVSSSCYTTSALHWTGWRVVGVVVRFLLADRATRRQSEQWADLFNKVQLYTFLQPNRTLLHVG